MKVKILLNPYANRWLAKSKAPAIEQACLAAGLEFDLSLVPEPGGGKNAAVAALNDGYDAVIAAGGDGTVSEVANGLISSSGDQPTAPLGVLPLGTGNDFSDMNGLPRDLDQAVRVIVEGYTIRVDAAQVTIEGNRHYFDNNCALAMEPMVTLEHIRMKRTSGNIRYVLAMFKALARLKAWQMELYWGENSYRGPAYLLSVCNGPRTGGLFPMAPGAKMDDGLLDFVLAPEVGKLRIPALLVRLFRGTHVLDPRITYARASALRINCNPPTPVHADGEIICEAASRIEYEVIPGKLTLLSPKPGAASDQ